MRHEQGRWLAEVIRRPAFRNAPYRVVFCHIPLRWRNETPPDYAQGGFDRFSASSRAAWHDSLVSWKTQLVISGHTHSHAWLPPSAEFPYGQLIGGGPSPHAATWMHGRAGETSLNLTVNNLDGQTLYELDFAPLS